MKIIDLFSGCGGLTEGFRSNDFDIVCHVEMDKDACSSLLLREAYYYLKEHNNISLYNKYISKKISREKFFSFLPETLNQKIINEEINTSTIDTIFSKIDNILKEESVFGIIGGPPCQAYSTIGRARNEQKKKNDERIYLYEFYISFLSKYKPEFFIFENVKGLLSFKDEHGEFLFPRMKKQFSKAGYELEERIINTKEYGIPQARERVIIFGKKKVYNNLNFFKILEKEKMIPINIKELFHDLPSMNDGEEKNKYRKVKPHIFVKEYLRDEYTPLTQNISRPHSQRDKEIYRIAVLKKDKYENLKYNDLPNFLKTHQNTTSFLDRYKVIDKNDVSHTIVAHISKDGHYYIHPDIKQNRSLTVREAARIQSFPDNFYFEQSRTSAFKQIGNAVPPLLSYKMAETILKLFL